MTYDGCLQLELPLQGGRIPGFWLIATLSSRFTTVIDWMQLHGMRPFIEQSAMHVKESEAWSV